MLLSCKALGKILVLVQYVLSFLTKTYSTHNILQISWVNKGEFLSDDKQVMHTDRLQTCDAHR